MKNDEVIIAGQRNTTDGLWDIYLPNHSNAIPSTSSSDPKIITIITKDKTKTQLAQYLLATAFCLAMLTFKRAIENGKFSHGMILPD